MTACRTQEEDDGSSGGFTLFVNRHAKFTPARRSASNNPSGIGPINAVTILAEAGDLRHFRGQVLFASTSPWNPPLRTWSIQSGRREGLGGFPFAVSDGINLSKVKSDTDW